MPEFHCLQLFFDGSSLGSGKRGGPAASAGAAIVVDSFGQIHRRSIYLARSDSDTAEYWGLMCGLELVREMGVSRLQIFGDSRNVIDSILGKKAIRKPALVQLNDRALAHLQQIPEWTIQWIPRRKNLLADAEAKRERAMPTPTLAPLHEGLNKDGFDIEKGFSNRKRHVDSGT